MSCWISQHQSKIELEPISAKHTKIYICVCVYEYVWEPRIRRWGQRRGVHWLWSPSTNFSFHALCQSSRLFKLMAGLGKWPVQWSQLEAGVFESERTVHTDPKFSWWWRFLICVETWDGSAYTQMIDITSSKSSTSSIYCVPPPEMSFFSASHLSFPDRNSEVQNEIFTLRYLDGSQRKAQFSALPWALRVDVCWMQCWLLVGKYSKWSEHRVKV